jgi:hypothetical protein
MERNNLALVITFASFTCLTCVLDSVPEPRAPFSSTFYICMSLATAPMDRSRKQVEPGRSFGRRLNDGRIAIQVPPTYLLGALLIDKYEAAEGDYCVPSLS